MDGLIMTAQLILALSILVGIHEWGHMVAAKMFGMKVEKFSIGFPPKIFSVTYGETEYSIGAIPLGGFVKIAGMMDESLDTENLSKEPEPWEFRAKPVWQRLIVMLGGIIMNVLLGILIFSMMTFSYGESYIAKEELNKYGIVPSELAKELGFQAGDKIVKVNGADYESFSDLTGPKVLLADNGYYELERAGKIIKIDIPKGFLDKMSEQKDKQALFSPITPFKVGMVSPGTGASKAGLEVGDYIVNLDGKEVSYFHELQAVLSQNKGKEIAMKYKREGTIHDVMASIDEDGKLGFLVETLLIPSHNEYGFFESFPVGTTKAFSVITTQLKAFGKMFTGELSFRKSIGGPIEIAQMFGGTWSWVKFWGLTGLLSMVLAFMNLLPIPALDGGHVMFLTYEAVAGRPPSDKFLEVAQKIGMVLLLSLMAYVILNGLYKVIFL